METQEDNMFGRRLKNARLMRGISMEMLRNSLDNTISKMAISKYENGKMKPSSDVLLKLSRALDLPIDYFFRPFNYSVENLKFKTPLNVSKTEYQKISHQIVDIMERYLEIEELCSVVPSLKLQISEEISFSKEVINLAIKFKKEWQLGEGGIVSVYSFIEKLGVKLIEIETSAKIESFTALINENQNVIVLNKNCTTEIKRFAALAELAKMIIKFSPNLSDKEQEHLCNLFANEMLISQEVFIKKLGSKRVAISYFELIELQKEFGLPIKVLIDKAKFFNIISDNRANSYFKEIKNENSFYPFLEKNRFTLLVYRSLGESIISISKAASLLNENSEVIKNNLLSSSTTSSISFLA
jgi:Zn-dependent peptidase ImmA (M78 family)/DNA-binding XRE family transcriptional regulator